MWTIIGTLAGIYFAGWIVFPSIVEYRAVYANSDNKSKRLKNKRQEDDYLTHKYLVFGLCWPFVTSFFIGWGLSLILKYTIIGIAKSIDFSTKFIAKALSYTNQNPNNGDKAIEGISKDRFEDRKEVLR